MKVVKFVVLLLSVAFYVYFNWYWTVGGNTDNVLALAIGVTSQKNVIAQTELVERLKSWSWLVPVVIAVLMYGPGLFKTKKSIKCSCHDVKCSETGG